MKKIVLLFIFSAFCFGQPNSKEVFKNMDLYTKNDTLQCFLLNQNIEGENNHNIWIKCNQKLKSISLIKSKSETNPTLKKTYQKYLSIAYNNEGAYYIYTEKFDKAIQLYKESLKITHKIKYDYGSALALQNIGTAFDYLGKLDSTLLYMQKAYFYAKRSKSKTSLAYILTDLGFIHNNLGNNTLAIKYNLEALPLFEKLQDIDGLERTYFSLARIFDNQNDYKTSSSYYETCLKINRKRNDKERLTLILNSLAAVKIKQKQLDISLEYTNEAFLLASKSNNLDFIGTAHKNYADIYIQKQDFEKAEINYLKAYGIFTKINSTTNVSKVAIKLASLYSNINNLSKAEEYGLIGYDLSKKTNFIADTKNASEILSEIYFKGKNFKNAYKFKSIAFTISKETFFDEKNDIALKAKHKYETEKKQNHIASLQKDNKIANLENKRHKSILISLSLFILSLLIFGYFIFNRFKIKKQNELLKLQLHEAEKTILAEKKASHSELKALKSQMNPHFFFNALNTIQSYIATNETQEATDYLNKFSKLTRMILEMTDKNWISIDEEIKMQTLYLNLQKIRLSDFNFQINIKNNNILNATMPTMLLQPYIENAVIHGLAHKKGMKNVVINFEINNQNQLEIKITDNGIGLTKANEINQKNINKNTSFATKATLERLEIINRNDLKISIEANELFDNKDETQGTEIKITMDLHYE